ncbi:DUF2946 domain-containing protein [Parapusillimonas sp. SGNA-6]|nr:DUF2946 domain-containing protein [Parapusillimonas sp. SGNA-6]
MSRNRRSYYSAWLALLSMLLISIAPVISQSLGAAHASGLSGYALQTDYCGQPPDASHDVSPALPDEGGPAHEPCPYCSLLTHLPLLTGGHAAALPASAWLMRRMPANPSDACPTPPAFSHALSRAPPTASEFLTSCLERDA